MIDDLVAQIEARFEELEGELSDPAVIGDRASVHRAQPRVSRARAGRSAGRPPTAGPPTICEGARELLAEDDDDPELRALLESSREQIESLGEEIRLAMVERDPNDEKNVIVEIRPGAGRRRGRRCGRATCTGCSPATPSGAGSRSSRCRSATGPTRSRSRATAPTRCSSSRAAPTASSGSRRPSPRAGSTPRRRPSRCSPRSTTSRSRSTPAISRSTSTGARVRAGSRSTRPTRRCGSPTSRAGSSSRCRTRSPSCRTASARCGCCARGCTSGRWPSSRPSWPPPARRRSERGERAEKIRTYNFPEKRVKDHRINLLVHNLDAILMGELDELTAALQDDEKRRRLAGEGGCLRPSR